MSDSIFDFVAKRLEEASGLDRLEARGTLRIGLKAAGLDPARVTPGQMTVALLRTMPKELSSRGVASAQDHCRAIAGSLADAFPREALGTDPDSPEVIFGRLGRSLDS